MRAIVCHQFAPPGNLEIQTVEDPVPSEGEVRLRIEATGLGFVDALTVAGLYQIKPPLPFIPGNEIAGVVDATGPGVKAIAEGQRVLAMPSRGGLAEMVCVPAAACVTIPDVMSYAAAASFPVNYSTAYHGLMTLGDLRAGETILILGASGGVGVAAIDIAKSVGASVIAAASTDEKRKACIDLGAEAAVDYTQKDWRNELKSVLGDRSLDVVYDPVGGEFAEPALRSLGPGGRFLVVGFAGGDIPRIALNLPLLKRISIVGVNWGGHVAGNPSESVRVLSELMALVESGSIVPEAGETFPLDKAGDAMMRQLERKAVGKTVILAQE
jgi:NADPH2:quinone reductase